MLAIDVVTKTTNEMTDKVQCLPGPLISGVTFFNKIHRVWRWFRLGNIYSNPNNFLNLAAGHGLNLAFGNSLLLRISATCVLIATRILECIKQQFHLQEAWSNLVSAFEGRLMTPIKMAWETKASQTFFSASTIAWWKSSFRHIWERIQRIALCTLKLIKQIFVLCMRITDAIETFSLTPEVQNEGVNLLFVNSAKWIESLVDNKEALIKLLKENNTLINKILSGIHSSLNSRQLIKSVEAVLNKTEKLHLATKEINDGFALFINACLKNWGYQFMYELGLHHIVPRHLIPSSRPPWETPKHHNIKNKNRFPPDKLITKPSLLHSTPRKKSINPSYTKTEFSYTIKYINALRYKSQRNRSALL